MGTCDGVIGHISERQNGYWMKTMALLRDRSIWHPAPLDKLDVNMNLGQFLCVICMKNLCESGISSPPWGAPYLVPRTKSEEQGEVVLER